MREDTERTEEVVKIEGKAGELNHIKIPAPMKNFIFLILESTVERNRGGSNWGKNRFDGFCDHLSLLFKALSNYNYIFRYGKQDIPIELRRF